MPMPPTSSPWPRPGAYAAAAAGRPTQPTGASRATDTACAVLGASDAAPREPAQAARGVRSAPAPVDAWASPLVRPAASAPPPARGPRGAPDASDATRSPAAPDIRTCTTPLAPWAPPALDAALERQARQLDGHGISRLARELQRQRRPRDVRALLAWGAMRGPRIVNVVLFNQLLSACAGDAPALGALALRLHAEPHLGSAITYTALMQGLCRAGRIEDAQRVLDDMHDAQVDSDVAAYTPLLEALVRAGRLDDARALVDDMVEHGPGIDLLAGNMLLGGLCSAAALGPLDAPGRAVALARIDALVASMRDAGATPDVYTYNTWLAGCARAGSVERAWAAWAQMLRDEVAPDTISGNALLQALAASGRAAELDAGLRALVRANVAHDARTATILVHAATPAQAAHDSRGSATADANRDAAVRAGGEVAWQRYTTAMAQGIRLDGPLSCAALRAAAACTEACARTEEVLARMQHGRVHADATTYTVALSTLVRRGTMAQAERALVAMRAAGHAPEAVSSTALIAGYGDRGELARARVHFDAWHARVLRDTGDVGPYVAMVAAYARVGRPAEAQRIMALLRASGAATPDAAQCALVNAYYNAGTFSAGVAAIDVATLGPEARCAYADLLRKAGQLRPARALCQEIMAAQPENSDAYARAWLVDVFVRLRLAPKALRKQRLQPPFGADSVHQPRYLCAQAFIDPVAAARAHVLPALLRAQREPHNASLTQDLRGAIALVRPHVHLEAHTDGAAPALAPHDADGPAPRA